MLSKETQGGFNPKHRVVGAIILVSAAVIILPLVLNKNEPPEHEAVGRAPAAGTRTVVAPIPPVVRSAQVTQPQSGPVAQTEAAPPSSGPTPATPTTTATTAAAHATGAAEKIALEKAAPKSAKSAPEQSKTENTTTAKPATARTKSARTKPRAKLQGWYVQVGTFSSTDNAHQLADKLKKRGFDVQLESTTLNQARVLRVRVGPYAGNAQAKTAQAGIKETVGIRGVIGRY